MGHVSFLDQFEAGESISEVPSIIRAILPSFLIKWARPSLLNRNGEGKVQSAISRLYAYLKVPSPFRFKSDGLAHFIKNDGRIALMMLETSEMDSPASNWSRNNK